MAFGPRLLQYSAVIPAFVGGWTLLSDHCPNETYFSGDTCGVTATRAL